MRECREWVDNNWDSASEGVVSFSVCRFKLVLLIDLSVLQSGPVRVAQRVFPGIWHAGNQERALQRPAFGDIDLVSHTEFVALRVVISAVDHIAECWKLTLAYFFITGRPSASQAFADLGLPVKWSAKYRGCLCLRKLTYGLIFCLSWGLRIIHDALDK
jgi:hypothetical protein